VPLFGFYFSLLPLRGQPTVEYHPRWQPIQGLAVHYRLGRLPDSNPELQVYSLVSLPMSHHCSLENTTHLRAELKNCRTVWVPDTSCRVETPSTWTAEELTGKLRDAMTSNEVHLTQHSYAQLVGNIALTINALCEKICVKKLSVLSAVSI
jgi:hypothetical protein